MKTAKIIFSLWLTATLAVSAFVYENDTEFQSSGDFNGDGRTDAIIVDKSGSYRIGYQQVDGSLSWSDARSTLLPAIDGFTLGRLSSTNFDSLGFASVTGNRTYIFDASHSSSSPAPTEISFNLLGRGLGPSMLIALDAYTTYPYEDLIISTSQNSDSAHSNFVGFIESRGSNIWRTMSGSTASGPWTRGNRFFPKAGVTNWYAILRPTESFGDHFDLLRIDPGYRQSGSGGTDTSYMYGHYDYVVDFFGTNTLSEFVVYNKDIGKFYVYHLEETAPEVFDFSTPVSTTLPGGRTIDQIFVVQSAGTNALLMLLNNRTTAELYAFDGSKISLSQTNFSLAANTTQFTGAIPLENGEFILLNGAADGISSVRQCYAFNGSEFALQSTDNLPPAGSTANRANVMAYQEEPFVSDFPKRVAAWHTGDWTTNAILSPSVEADSLTDEGLTNGLRNSSRHSLAATPSGAFFTLNNQPHAAISAYSFDNAYGTEIADIRISPAPGTFSTAIQISFTNSGSSPLFYRPGSGDWLTYTNNPFWLYKDTVVAYYTTNTFGRSPLYFASFTFTLTPDEMDSDGDSVPDYVEIYHDLNPVESGSDADGDGLSDLDELLQSTDPALADTDKDTYTDMEELRAGTDPLSAASMPTRPITNNFLTLASADATYDLAITPTPFTYTTTSNSYALTNMQMRAFGTEAALLAFALTADCSSHSDIITTNPTALLSPLSATRTPAFVIASTPENYPLRSGGTNSVQGRAMLGIFPRPDLPPVTVSSTYSNGSLSAEAAAWLTAAQATYSNISTYTAVTDLSITDTLAALLYERAIGDLLFEAGTLTNRVITLFPFRTADSGMPSPTSAQLIALETRNTNSAYDAYQLIPLFTNINTALQLNTAAINNLHYVNTYLYRTSSRYSQDTPGKFRQPINVLRDFILYGSIDSAYTSTVFLSDATMDSAFNGIADILDSLPSRPVVTLPLQYTTNSAINLYTTNTPATPYRLYAAAHIPYTFPQAFDLLPGTRMNVTAYTDLTEDCAPAAPLQVISIALTALPPPSNQASGDSSLPIAWQLEVFGSTGHDAAADDDHDGFSNLYEYLGSSNANNSNSIPDQPELYVAVQPDGTIRMDWPWWENYVTDFVFHAESTPSLTSTFTSFETIPEGDLTFTIDPAASNPTSLFFRITIEAR